MGGSLPLAFKRGFYLLLLLPLFALVFSHSLTWIMDTSEPACLSPMDDSSLKPEIHRSDFPDHFVFGAATSAYQVEGAAAEGGRGPSIWDTFSSTPGKIVDGSNGDVAVDQYHRYKEDVDLLKSLNADAYRFSISWTRIIPDGEGPGVNEEGIAYYNSLIDTLLSKGIQPYVTLYHWDLPATLQEKYGGWISSEVVNPFAYYAEVCFSRFGDRVKKWITFNEPIQIAWNGYGVGAHAPGRTSDRSISPVGNSSTEPYLAGHNVLLSHGAAVEIYRQKYQRKQGGTIGFTVDCEWAEPLTNSTKDIEAAERRLAFELGWWLDPIFFGDYPAIMREIVGARLPTFTADQILLLRDSVDFLGLNHYTTRWVSSAPLTRDLSDSNYWQDQCVHTSDHRDGVMIGERAYSPWLLIVPWGLRKFVNYVADRYKAPIYITENGMDTHNNESFTRKDFLQDTLRVNYYRTYLASLLDAIKDGADVRGYFAWSLLDNFEWAYGYTSRFGLYYVDYSDMTRHAKDSARWYSKFLQTKTSEPCEKV